MTFSESVDSCSIVSLDGGENPSCVSDAAARTTRFRKPVLSSSDGTDSIETHSKSCDADMSGYSAGGVKKHVLLPARSLAVLSGPARHLWSHGIAPRKFDKVSCVVVISCIWNCCLLCLLQVNGELIRRSRRISFTFREARHCALNDDRSST